MSRNALNTAREQRETVAKMSGFERGIGQIGHLKKTGDFCEIYLRGNARRFLLIKSRNGCRVTFVLKLFDFPRGKTNEKFIVTP